MNHDLGIKTVHNLIVTTPDIHQQTALQVFDAPPLSQLHLSTAKELVASEKHCQSDYG